MNPVPASSRAPQRAPHPMRNPVVRLVAFLRQPVVAWVGVLFLATFSFYVHLLNEQVERGADLRAAQRSGAAPAATLPGRHPPSRGADRVYR